MIKCFNCVNNVVTYTKIIYLYAQYISQTRVTCGVVKNIYPAFVVVNK